MDGLCFPMFLYVHSKFRTPFYVILLYMIIGMVTSIFFDLGSILSFTAVALLINYMSVIIGVLIKRYSLPSFADDSDICW